MNKREMRDLSEGLLKKSVYSLKIRALKVVAEEREHLRETNKMRLNWAKLKLSYSWVKLRLLEEINQDELEDLHD